MISYISWNEDEAASTARLSYFMEPKSAGEFTRFSSGNICDFLDWLRFISHTEIRCEAWWTKRGVVVLGGLRLGGAC